MGGSARVHVPFGGLRSRRWYVRRHQSGEECLIVPYIRCWSWWWRVRVGVAVAVEECLMWCRAGSRSEHAGTRRAERHLPGLDHARPGVCARRSVRRPVAEWLSTELLMSKAATTTATAATSTPPFVVVARGRSASVAGDRRGRRRVVVGGGPAFARSG